MVKMQTTFSFILIIQLKAACVSLSKCQAECDLKKKKHGKLHGNKTIRHRKREISCGSLSWRMTPLKLGDDLCSQRIWTFTIVLTTCTVGTFAGIMALRHLKVEVLPLSLYDMGSHVRTSTVTCLTGVDITLKVWIWILVGALSARLIVSSASTPLDKPVYTQMQIYTG